VNKTKYLAPVVLATVVFGAAISCQKAENKNTASNQTAPKANQAAIAATPAAGDTSTSSVATPTDAYKAAYTARKNKDIDGIKKVMSKDLLAFLADMGSGEKKTLDDELKELCTRPQAATAEARNEKINGDEASIEYVDEEGKWQPMDFVKEDGAWKMTLAKADKDSPDDDDKGDKDKN